MTAIVVAVVATVVAARVAAVESSWRVARAEVRVVCPLTVGGSFEAKTGALGGTLALQGARPAALRGELSVDLKTLDTGIGLRNDHLKYGYLEVLKGDGFDHAVLSEIRLASVDSESFQGRTAFTGVLRLHGTKQRVEGNAEIRREVKGFRVEASFVVSLANFGIARPQYLGVGVKNEIQVTVSINVSSEART